MAERLPLVYNPRSAGGEGDARFRLAETALAVHNVRVDPIPTEGPGGATPLVERLASEGHRTVLVVGGDGTHNEAAEAALRAKTPVTLGLLPGGTANDLLLDLGTADVNEAARRIAAQTSRAIDAALVEHAGGRRHFINVFHSGFAARVGALANRRFKWMGAAGYKVAVVTGVVMLRTPPTRIVVDGKPFEDRVALTAVCNTRHTGGKMDMAPMADPADGLLDVIGCTSISRIGLLRLFPKIFPGTHLEDPRVFHLRGRRIEIRPEEDGPLVFDGEVDGTTPVTITVQPGALSVLA